MNDVMMNPMSDRGKQIIRYSNIIRIIEVEYLYSYSSSGAEYHSYSYLGDFLKQNSICIRPNWPKWVIPIGYSWI